LAQFQVMENESIISQIMNKNKNQYFTISSLLHDSKKAIAIPYVKGNIWHNSVVHEYNKFNETVPNCNRHVNFLLYCGITFANSEQRFLAENLAYQYSYSAARYELNTFSKKMHSYLLRKLPFVVYICCIAYPCNIIVQLQNGIYYGFFAIPYFCVHTMTLHYAFIGSTLCQYVPEFYWDYFFRGLGYLLETNHEMYALCNRDRSIMEILFEIFAICACGYFSSKYLL